MRGRIIGIGASAGGIEALHTLLPLLQPEWQISFAIVIHRGDTGDGGRLDALLNSWSGIPVGTAQDGAPILPGRAVVSPANVHLVVDGERYALTSGPRENHSRPAVDVTFRSIAQQRGALGGGIVLSGLLDDGAAGIRAISEAGGLTIAQSPSEALHSGMPASAIASGVDHVLSLADMPRILEDFAQRHAHRHTLAAVGGKERLTRFRCPDCGGVLGEELASPLPYYRCRVGHTFSLHTLSEQKDIKTEEALWSAIEVLEEQAELSKRAADWARAGGKDALASRLDRKAAHFHERAATVQGSLPKIEEALNGALSPSVRLENPV